MKLIIFPHAGGFASYYHEMAEKIDSEVIVFEYSGRGRRASRESYSDFEELICDAVEKLSEYFLKDGEDYCLFGHSMGTVLVTEFVKQTKAKGLPQPCHIFLSGKNPPDEDVHCFENVESASDDEIVSFFTKNSLSSNAPVPDEELMRALNRVLCTDVRMAERYKATPDEVKFGCDITVIYGKDNPLMQSVDMNSWSRFTKGNCQVICYSGGHFYYTDHKEEVCKVIAERIC